jgi:Ca-activated chloride channel family protein
MPYRFAVIAASLAVATALEGRAAQTVFKSGVDVVTVTATVTDGDGRFIRDLRREDFTVLDNGAPQELLNFSSERVPVSLGLVLDVSQSMTDEKLAAARISINRFIYDLLDKEDELFLVAFARRAQMLQTWTSNRGTLSRALDRARPQRGTSLYDAVVAALPVAGSGLHQKKAMLVLSDGADTGSRTPVKAAQDAIRASEVLVYALGIESDGDIDAGALRKLTDDTGGRTEVVKGFRNLDGATARLAAELSQQYVMSYAAPVVRDRSWRTIKVDVRRRGVNVRARSGYFAP